MITVVSTYDVQPNQSWKDVVLQCLGSMEAAGQFCQDNGVSFTSVPPVGAMVVVSAAAVALAGAAGVAVVASYTANGVQVGNLNLGQPLLNDDGNVLLNDDGDELFADR